MNPGPVEEAGKVATGFIESMKEQPLALALVICNLVLLGLFFYVAKTASDNRATEFKAVLEAQREVQQLLFNCVPHSLPPMPLRRPPEAPAGE